MAGHPCRAAGHRAKLVGVAGLVPQAGYGTEVTGLDDREWNGLRRSLAAGIGPKAGGRSLALALLLEGDSTTAVALAPAVRWAEEVWAAACGEAGALTLPQLLGAWYGALARRPRKWGDVKGPIGAAWLTLRCAGWDWPAPLTFASPQGHQYLLTEWAPALLRQKLVAAERASLEKTAAARMRRREFSAPLGEAWSAQRISVAAVARVLTSRKRPLDT